RSSQTVKSAAVCARALLPLSARRRAKYIAQNWGSPGSLRFPKIPIGLIVFSIVGQLKNRPEKTGPRGVTRVGRKARVGAFKLQVSGLNVNEEAAQLGMREAYAPVAADAEARAAQERDGFGRI